MAKLVLLEDDVDFVDLLCEALISDGHEVVAFDRGTDAAEYAMNNDVDLLICDMFIKDGDEMIPDGGIKLISKLKQVEDLRIPVLAISGSFSDMDTGYYLKTAAKTVGADDILSKPFEHEELRARIDGLLARSR